jgi:proprotein convertase subtilisin/kexin type 5
MLSGGTCSTACTAGYFFNSTIVNCQSCSTGCLACNSAQFCQMCQNGYFILSTNDTANQCVQNCGSQKYASSVGASCKSCVYPCFNCASTIQCLSCQEGVLYQSRCLSTCPDTTYLDTVSSNCSPCQGNCLTCS